MPGMLPLYFSTAAYPAVVQFVAIRPGIHIGFRLVPADQANSSLQNSTLHAPAHNHQPVVVLAVDAEARTSTRAAAVACSATTGTSLPCAS